MPHVGTPNHTLDAESNTYAAPNDHLWIQLGHESSLLIANYRDRGTERGKGVHHNPL